MKPYFERDGIVIYHGDCREILPSIAPGSVDLVLTDPPYGVREKTKRSTRIGARRSLHSGNLQHPNWSEIIGDGAPFDPASLLVFPKVITWGANHYAERLPSSPSWLVWDKREGIPSNDNADCEMAWTNLGGPARLYRQLWSGVIVRGEENAQRRLHPTQKPVGLMSWCLQRARLEAGALILDPYMGSGPVAAACQRAGFRYIGIEIEERYCEIAARRLDQMVLPLEAVS